MGAAIVSPTGRFFLKSKDSDALDGCSYIRKQLYSERTLVSVLKKTPVCADKRMEWQS